MLPVGVNQPLEENKVICIIKPVMSDENIRYLFDIIMRFLNVAWKKKIEINIPINGNVPR